ncbi:hypothetical protein RSOLAG1IB_07813 [Rhizoctonia solani AG-1 IB]|uniref:Zn(2)-C6 fungal-type domain-containing protein n=1 Tax=Thanatephorus cucumeris (strain AG1-IB / isolate 7/3/14) TaxID=1108050 RepID=A0A0B7FEF8_THACB|nr:hypothetical protein RSOLAG1IB_07813 [Rhizoctonia solani AG-1 IB]
MTCRRRRKKCDLVRPCCERCLKGGYECLGYEHINPRVKVYPRNPEVAPQSRYDIGTTQANVMESNIEEADPITGGFSGDWRDPEAPADSPSILGTALLYRISGSAYLNNSNNATTTSEDFNRSWPQDSSQSVVYSRTLIDQSSLTRRRIDTPYSASNLLVDIIRAVQMSSRSIPPSVTEVQSIRRML